MELTGAFSVTMFIAVSAAPAEHQNELPTDPLRTLPAQLNNVAVRLTTVFFVDYIFGGLLIRLIQDIF